MVASVQWYSRNLAALPPAVVLCLSLVLRPYCHKWEGGFGGSGRLLLEQLCLVCKSEVLLAKQYERKLCG